MYRVFPGGKERPGRDADPSPLSSAVGHERVELYLYSPSGPCGLYRASVPVQGWPLPLPYFSHKHSNNGHLHENLIYAVLERAKVILSLTRKREYAVWTENRQVIPRVNFITCPLHLSKYPRREVPSESFNEICLQHWARVSHLCRHIYIYLAFSFNSTNYRYNYCRDKIKNSSSAWSQHAAYAGLFSLPCILPRNTNITLPSAHGYSEQLTNPINSFFF